MDNLDRVATRLLVALALAPFILLILLGLPELLHVSFHLLVNPFAWILLGSILAAFVLRRRTRNRLEQRLRAGLCINCGYDLRATRGRCPECGTVPAKKQL
jgi:peptidoglycan/LPS O-acetylase OafA/YrhL